MPKKMSAWRISGFTGGLNTALDTRVVPPSDSPDCDNVVFGLDGVVRRRAGWATYQSSWTGSSPAMAEYWREGTFVVVGTDGVARVVSDSGVATVTSLTGLNTSEIWSAYSMNGLFYATNRVGGAFEVNGTTGSAISIGAGSSVAGDPPGSQPSSGVHPAARYAAVLKDRVFVANMKESSLNFYSRIRWSEFSDPESWAYNNFIDVEADDFDEITGLEVVHDRLVIFKKNSLYMLIGHTIDDMELVAVASGNLGCPYPKTICRGDNVIYFVGNDGVKSFDGQTVNHLSLKIDGFSGTPVSAAYANRKYYLTVDDSGTRRVYVYDADIQAWTKWSGVPAARLIADSRVNESQVRVYASRSDAAQMMRLESGTDDDGTDIDAYFTTGWNDLNSPEVRKRVRKCYVTTGGEQTNDMTLELYSDWDDSLVDNVILVTDPSPDSHGLKRSGAGIGTVRALRCRVENVTGGALHVDSITFSYFPRRFR